MRRACRKGRGTTSRLWRPPARHACAWCDWLVAHRDTPVYALHMQFWCLLTNPCIIIFGIRFWLGFFTYQHVQTSEMLGRGLGGGPNSGGRAIALNFPTHSSWLHPYIHIVKLSCSAEFNVNLAVIGTHRPCDTVDILFKTLIIHAEGSEGPGA